MEKRASLKVEVLLPEGPLSPGGSRHVTVRVTNAGDAPAMINHRLAIGYRDQLSRELYADLLDLETGKQTKIRKARYNRDFSPPSDYSILDPDKSVEATFDFFQWYMPETPGAFQLILHYQANEKLASHPVNVVNGVFSSKPVKIEIKFEHSTHLK